MKHEHEGGRPTAIPAGLRKEKQSRLMKVALALALGAALLFGVPQAGLAQRGEEGVQRPSNVSGEMEKQEAGKLEKGNKDRRDGKPEKWDKDRRDGKPEKWDKDRGDGKPEKGNKDRGDGKLKKGNKDRRDGKPEKGNRDRRDGKHDGFNKWDKD